jgi:hypothetical protein
MWEYYSELASVLQERLEVISDQDLRTKDPEAQLRRPLGVGADRSTETGFTGRCGSYVKALFGAHEPNQGLGIDSESISGGEQLESLQRISCAMLWFGVLPRPNIIRSTTSTIPCSAIL